jgi:6-phosphogluconolactonase (cycloisomerase 2 family)
VRRATAGLRPQLVRLLATRPHTLNNAFCERSWYQSDYDSWMLDRLPEVERDHRTGEEIARHRLVGFALSQTPVGHRHRSWGPGNGTVLLVARQVIISRRPLVPLQVVRWDSDRPPQTNHFVCLTVSHDGNRVYATCEASPRLLVLSRRGSDRQWRRQDLPVGETRDPGLSWLHGVVVSPDDRDIYVSDGYGSTLALIQSSPTGEELTTARTVARDLPWGRSLVVTPDGRNLYAAYGALVGYRRDPATGELTPVQVIEGELDAPMRTGVAAQVRKPPVPPVVVRHAILPFAVALDPEARHLYVACNQSHSLLCFERNASDGTIRLVQTVQATDPGVRGLQFPAGLCVAPDGRHVYLACIADHLVTFARNPQSGSLTFQDALRDNTNGVDGLDYATSVVPHPDGHAIFVAGVEDSAIAVFRRDVTTGGLEFVDAIKNGQLGVSGLWHVEQLAVSPDGRYLYAASSEPALCVFAISP